MLAAADISEEQALLLHACFADTPASWKAWQAQVDVDHLDPDSQWLLPLLFRRLHTLGVNHPLMQRYRSVYLHNWYKNNLLLHHLHALTHVLRGAGITYVLGRGLGCLVLYYDDVGVRPLSAADLIIAPKQWHAASSCLTRNNVPYVHSEGQAIRIMSTPPHLTVRLVPPPDSLQDDFWAACQPVALDVWPFYALQTEDLLTYMHVEKPNWDNASGLLWYADRMAISMKSSLAASHMRGLV